MRCKERFAELATYILYYLEIGGLSSLFAFSYKLNCWLLGQKDNLFLLALHLGLGVVLVNHWLPTPETRLRERNRRKDEHPR